VIQTAYSEICPESMGFSFYSRGFVFWQGKRDEVQPAGFLELARWWPKVTEEKRLALEEMVPANWAAGRLVDYWSEEFPEVTDRTFIALKELDVRSRTSDAGELDSSE